jgi:cobalt/nickel transport system permease protein
MMMDFQPPIHNISILWLFVPAAGLIILLGTLWGVLRYRKRRSQMVHDEEEAGWLQSEVSLYADLRSSIHAWDPRVKIVSLLSYIFCVGALTQLEWAILGLGISLVLSQAARIPIGFILKRLVLLSGFLGMFFVVMPLTVRVLPGDILYTFHELGFIKINPRGLLIAALALSKASAIVVMMLILFGTNRFPVIIRALASLRVPPIVIQMVLMCYRYLFVFVSEMQRMATAMKARGFKKKTNLQTLKIMGNFIGVLLVRSFERTERVYDAMLSRGYTGRIRTMETPLLKKKDILLGTLCAGIGFLLLGLDHLAPAWFI